MQTREILMALLDQGSSPETVDAFNRLLDRGAVHYRLGPGGPEYHPRTDDRAWLPSWLAAADYLRLIADNPSVIQATS